MFTTLILLRPPNCHVVPFPHLQETIPDILVLENLDVGGVIEVRREEKVMFGVKEKIVPREPEMVCLTIH